jgi:uncharacterized protein DUF955
MTYIAPAQIEARAAELWQRHALEPGFDVELLLDDLGLDLLWEFVDDEGPGGAVLGQLIPDKRRVVLNERHIERLEAKHGRLRRYTVGHEIGHWILHADAARRGNLPLFDGERIWCRARSPNPIERQAEMFSAALLIPKDRLLSALPQTRWSGWPTVYRLAETFIVNPTPMVIRLEELGWGHRDDHGVPASGAKPAPGQDSLWS